MIDSIVVGSRLMQAPEYHANDYRKRFSVEEMYEMVFVEAPTDMAMVQVVPQFEWFKEFYAPVQLQYELVQAYPERLLFCGGVDPLVNGLPSALEQLEYQVKELGAASIKFYNGHVPRGWRCDDEEVAYPMYEKCRELGLPLVVKPARGGSALGASIVRSADELPSAMVNCYAYGPVALIWFDTPRMMTPERSQRFINLVRELQPKCLIDGRLGVDPGDDVTDVLLVEQAAAGE